MKNIVLTGLMGSGKTSIGKFLKNIFSDFKFVEIDNLIEIQEKMPITEIFSKNGEEYFRKCEKNIVDNCLSAENQIISLGGGSLENNFNWEIAKKTSVLFYLKTDVNTLYDRIKTSQDRPLLLCENPKEKLNELLLKRECNYNKSNHIIDVTHLTIEETAKKVEKIYKNGTNC